MKDIISIIVLPSEAGTIMNHDAAGGVGCKNMSKKAKVFPPLTCLYIASILKINGYIVQFIDFNIINETKKNIIAYINNNKTSILYGSLPTLKLDIEILKAIDLRHKNVIYINAVAEIFRDEIFETGINKVISGDAEKSILAALNENLNVAFFNEYLTKEEMDNLLFPDWSICNIENYSSYTVLSSRGCSLGCPHCPYYRFQRNCYTDRDINEVIREIKMLIDTYNVDYFLFRDPCFTYDATRTRTLMKKLQKFSHVEWGCETRIEYLNEDLIKQMKEAGCHSIRMGIESVDETILKKAGRLNIVKDLCEYMIQAKNVVNWCKYYNIHSIQFYMVGFPDDTTESINNIKCAVTDIDPDVALVNFIVPYPGTVYRNEIEHLGLLNKDNDNYCNYGSKDIPVCSTKYLSYEQLLSSKNKLEKWLLSRNRQFYPIR